MGTHPIFESDFDCLTEMENENKPEEGVTEPSTSNVPIETTDEPVQTGPVQIEPFEGKKQWLGGFKHKVNNIEFHNAEAQTNRKVRVHAAERNSRETQTTNLRNKQLNTSQNAATQMTKPGVYVSTRTDRVIIPGKYTLAATIEKRRVQAAIIIQKHYRRYMAQQIVAQLKKDLKRFEEWILLQKETKEKEKADRKAENLRRRLNPRTEKDFELVWHALEQWREEQIALINETTQTPAETKAALATLQEQVAQLVAAIGRHRTRAAEEQKEQRISKFLDACAAPRKWKARDGKWVQMVNWTQPENGKFEMDTGYTLRAKELRDLYNTLKMDELNVEERVDALLSLKQVAASVPDCKLTKEIIQLCEREAELLLRGINPSLLSGLRARILQLYFQFCREPKFNPEAARHLKVPQDPELLRDKLIKFNETNSYLSNWPLAVWPFAAPHDYDVSAAQKGQVESNRKPEIISIPRMLRDLRKAEYESEMVFILTEKDILTLVQKIWESRSAVSNSDEELVLTRWDFSKPWTPWNSFLVTKDELPAHRAISNAGEGYGRFMCQKVHQKHLMARQHFNRLREQSGGTDLGAGLNGGAIVGQAIKPRIEG